jgi:pentatricopeptide repeat protein
MELESLERDPIVGNALVDMYAKCGSLDKAEQVFHKLQVQDLVSWTSLIAGYAQRGESGNVFHAFEKMIRGGIKPNVVTFVNVLNACSHAGLVGEGQSCLMAMDREYGITQTSEHHTCMVDLLCRAGRVEEAVQMIEEMKFLLLVPDVVLWHTVLGACQKWPANVEIARHAFAHALHLDRSSSAAYVSMSNIYIADRENAMYA